MEPKRIHRPCLDLRRLTRIHSLPVPFIFIQSDYGVLLSLSLSIYLSTIVSIPYHRYIVESAIHLWFANNDVTVGLLSRRPPIRLRPSMAPSGILLSYPQHPTSWRMTECVSCVNPVHSLPFDHYSKFVRTTILIHTIHYQDQPDCSLRPHCDGCIHLLCVRFDSKFKCGAYFLAISFTADRSCRLRRRPVAWVSGPVSARYADWRIAFCDGRRRSRRHRRSFESR